MVSAKSQPYVYVSSIDEPLIRIIVKVEGLHQK
ncbi:hypothetical protein LSH36_660g05023 [Paralvinella palmiformis]|uniref:Uncharacterized protein n=1 Tax=Paralvinella palmiformis TaxID=53620 RepID=A0AAD9J438_9ANNE|nr:hypothetical protein LSH36_660g05023 [Paralvinella palmiformis]